MSDDYAVEITIGVSGEGSRRISLSPGETFAEVVDSTYVEVSAPELPEGPDDVQVEAVTTEEQDVSQNSDREWRIESVKCVKCGERFPEDYSMCPECGEENYDLEELEK